MFVRCLSFVGVVCFPSPGFNTGLYFLTDKCAVLDTDLFSWMFFFAGLALRLR
jgi:hypothetical protein